jgi:hypothetical protein
MILSVLYDNISQMFSFLMQHTVCVKLIPNPCNPTRHMIQFYLFCFVIRFAAPLQSGEQQLREAGRRMMDTNKYGTAAPIETLVDAFFVGVEQNKHYIHTHPEVSLMHFYVLMFNILKRRSQITSNTFISLSSVVFVVSTCSTRTSSFDHEWRTS